MPISRVSHGWRGKLSRNGHFNNIRTVDEHQLRYKFECCVYSPTCVYFFLNIFGISITLILAIFPEPPACGTGKENEIVSLDQRLL